MAYQLRVLDGIADNGPARLIAEVGAAIAAGGSWERFAEVRMSAGPTVRITPDGTGYLASVSWSSQHGQLKACTVQSAIECADRLAYLFYQMRDAEMIHD